MFKERLCWKVGFTLRICLLANRSYLVKDVCFSVRVWTWCLSLPNAHHEVVLTFSVSTNWAEFMSLCRNTKIRPTHVRRAEQGYDRHEIMPHLFAAKRGYDSKSDWGGVIQWHLHKLKTACLRLITSALPWCCARCLWAACPATARAGRRKRMCLPCCCPLVRVYSELVLSGF